MRGRGKVRWADKYFAKLLAKVSLQHKTGEERVECLMHPHLLPWPMTSGEETDPYESAKEHAGEVSDMSPYDVYDSDEESDDVIAYNTETSHHMTVADRNRQHKKQRQCRD